MKYLDPDEPASFTFTARAPDGDSTNPQDKEEKPALTTVELMTPRYPPHPGVWDFFPPLRIFKVLCCVSGSKRSSKRPRARE
jgi:hypothetical protein